MKKRNLYLNNTPVEEAQELFFKAIRQDITAKSETVAVVNSLDRITMTPIIASCSSPLSDSAAMDGIAVISQRTVGAGENTPVVLTADKDFRVVDTGDPINLPFDAVIMAEDIRQIDDNTVEIRSAASPWLNVRPIGEDIVQGEMILPGAHKIRPFDIGVLLSGGVTEVNVKKQPRVAIIPTGTEIIEPGKQPKEGEIIESNSRMLEALTVQAGGIPFRLAPVADDYELLRDTISGAIDDSDMLLVIAGSSAGTEDYTVHILRELGEVLVHGVAMKPGKPVILAKIRNKPIIGIPGYPVSAFLAYHNFALPVLSALSGMQQNTDINVRATITRRLVSSLKHKEYVRVKVGQVGDKLVATPLARGAGAAMSLVRADGFCIIEQDSEGVEAGADANIQLFRPLVELTSMIVCIGSHDLILDIINDFMTTSHSGASLSSTHVGSMGGLLALKKGEAHMVPTHILDEESGQYNIPIIKKLFSDEPMTLIKGVGRTQGIMVKKGNPLQIGSVEDLVCCRYVNRQRGAGTRILFDYLLTQSKIDPDKINGYDREAATHMAVAAAVKGENADAGIGVFSSAKAMELDFIPVGDEEYDFVVPTKFLELPHIQAFISILKTPAFHQSLEQLGGYTFTNCGEVLHIGC